MKRREIGETDIGRDRASGDKDLGNIAEGTNFLPRLDVLLRQQPDDVVRVASIQRNGTSPNGKPRPAPSANPFRFGRGRASSNDGDRHSRRDTAVPKTMPDRWLTRRLCRFQPDEWAPPTSGLPG